MAVQLIIIAAFGAVDKPLASCLLVDFLETQFKMIVGMFVLHYGKQCF